MKVTNPTEKSVSVDGEVMQFEQPIIDQVELSDRVIVLLDPDEFADGDELVGENVIAIGGDGEVIWRIQPCGGWVEGANGKMVPVAYFNLWQDTETGQMHVAVPDVILDLNPDDGTVGNGRYVR